MNVTQASQTTQADQAENFVLFSPSSLAEIHLHSSMKLHFTPSLLLIASTCLFSCLPDPVVLAVKINRITVTQFPTTLNGGNWDLFQTVGADADLLITVSIGAEEVWDSPNYDNCSGQYSYEFTPVVPIRVENLLSDVTVQLFDYDNLAPNEYMTGMSFTFEGYDILRPPSRTLFYDDFEIVLDLDWVLE